VRHTSVLEGLEVNEVTSNLMDEVDSHPSHTESREDTARPEQPSGHVDFNNEATLPHVIDTAILNLQRDDAMDGLPLHEVPTQFRNGVLHDEADAILKDDLGDDDDDW